MIEQIGEGGFGVVFVAEQKQPVRRLVALKLLKPGMDVSAHKQMRVDHSRRFGLNFDAPAYFAEYLSLSKTLACTGFSLHLLHMLHDLLQQVLLDQLHDRFGHDSETTSTLASCISASDFICSSLSSVSAALLC